MFQQMKEIDAVDCQPTFTLSIAGREGSMIEILLSSIKVFGQHDIQITCFWTCRAGATKN